MHPEARTLRIPTAIRLYRLAGRALTPFARAMLRRRLAAGKEHPVRLEEKLGRASAKRPAGSLVWVHAASVGETLSILPLIERLTHAGHSALLTTGTVTSAELAATRLPQGAVHQFAPLDLPPVVRRFLDHWRPDLAVFCESELWPNLMLACRERGIPFGIVNGRMSERSARRWKRFGALSRTLLSGVSFCLAQSREDCARYESLGAPASFPGNLKFDVAPLPVDGEALFALERAIGRRPIFLAASTHPGEEELALEAAARLREQEPELLTIIVPRHPARGAEIEALCRAGGIRPAVRSLNEMPDDFSPLYLADTLGELGLFYSLATVAFIGGSLVPIGGHNPIEPAKLSTPILHGPEVANFRDIYAVLDREDAAVGISDPISLADAVARLIADPARREALARHAARIARENEGALDATLRLLQDWLPVCEENNV
ncbi:MAG TPA: 3-deoxy-D-manno-octulosonic acid transferase [Rhabdaerophilum sp.]|nr:3-deoxy-D-manno-octulosonic acid transferase [Rhabdaerophilum sp.]